MWICSTNGARLIHIFSILKFKIMSVGRGRAIDYSYSDNNNIFVNVRVDFLGLLIYEYHYRVISTSTLHFEQKPNGDLEFSMNQSNNEVIFHEILGIIVQSNDFCGQCMRRTGCQFAMSEK